MRVLGVSALLVLTAVGTLGCGSGHGDLGGNRGVITRARAVAFARAVNLRPADVPGMEASGGREPEGQVVNFQLTPRDGCGPSDSGERFDVYSPSFNRPRAGRRVRAGGQVPLPAEGLHSKVSVMHTAAEQERDFSTQACERAHPRRQTGAVKIEQLPSPLAGVRVLAQRSSRIAPVSFFGTRDTSLYTDGFRFVVGPAEVLVAFMSAPLPPSAGLERRLVGLLYSRAKAHAL